MAKQDREELGEFSSTKCLGSLVRNVVKCGGSSILVQAGMGRGRELADDLGLKQGSYPDAELTAMLDKALGQNGTRLCIVDKVEQKPDKVTVWTRETACSYLQPDGSERECLFTMGAFAGVFQVISGKRVRVKQVESVLRGGDHDTFELQLMD
ncbi:MAG: hypothetical protein ACOC1F_02380 [Myxococcota bacterium]